MRASSTLLGALLLACACDSGAGLRCGPGTTQVEDECVPIPIGDAGVETITVLPLDAGPGGDAGDLWSTLPPGAPPPEPGCEGTECEAWQVELASLVAAQRPCSTPMQTVPGAQAVAAQHAAYQASIDGLTSGSPSGDLFAQLSARGVSYRYGGALFASTRTGPAEVMASWTRSPEGRAILAQCWTMAGVGFATSESGASYATVMLAR